MAELRLGPTVRDDDDGGYDVLPSIPTAYTVDGSNVEDCASYRGAMAHFGHIRKQMRDEHKDDHDHSRQTACPEDWVAKFPRSNRKF